MSKSALTLLAVIFACVSGCSDGGPGAAQPSAGSGGASGDGADTGGSGGSGGVSGASGEGGSGGTSGTSGSGGAGGSSGASGSSGGGGTGGDSGQGGGGGGGVSDCADMAVGDAEQRVRYAQAEIEPGETCLSEAQQRTCTEEGWSAWSGSYGAETCTVVVVEPDCDGMAETRTRYEAQQVAYGETCTPETQTRTCTGEVWGNWSGTFGFETCFVAAGADCEGAEHGADASRVRYEAASVAHGEECEAETQTAECENGTLGAWTGTFTFEACEPEPGLPCGATPDGGQEMRERFESELVPFGETCQAELQTRTCDDGVLGDWTGTAMFEECEVEPPADCADGTHGEMRARTRYQAATVAWGTSCVSEQQTETCDDGEWLPWTGTFAFDDCVVSDPLDCDGGVHGSSQTRTRYATASVPDGDVCESELQARACTNGAWGGWSGTFLHEDCDVLPPFAGSCTLSNAGEAYSCLDWVGTAYTSAIAIGACGGGTYSTSHCAEPSELLGVCAVPPSSGLANSETDVYYYESAVYANEAAAQQHCTVAFTGTWTSR